MWKIGRLLTGEQPFNGRFQIFAIDKLPANHHSKVVECVHSKRGGMRNCSGTDDRSAW